MHLLWRTEIQRCTYVPHTYAQREPASHQTIRLRLFNYGDNVEWLRITTYLHLQAHFIVLLLARNGGGRGYQLLSWRTEKWNTEDVVSKCQGCAACCCISERLNKNGTTGCPAPMDQTRRAQCVIKCIMHKLLRRWTMIWFYIIITLFHKEALPLHPLRAFAADLSPPHCIIGLAAV